METSEQIEKAVRDRYAAGARAAEAALCCPVEYDRKLLEVLPQEILEKDYGCGDPSAFVRPGDRVLDLGSGAGKICWMAAQVAGPRGSVLGVDFNDAMLELAERHRSAIAARVGYDTVRFAKGRIQDLRTDLRFLESHLRSRPVRGLEDLAAMEDALAVQRRERPLVPDGSIDLVISNCVLNLVEPGSKEALFAEMFRVLVKGGRVAISDIVSDEDVPEHLQKDPELWSGCISGAYREDRFLEAFEDAGFHGIELARRDATPWRTVEGIEFRSVTVTARKGKQGPCLERKQAVVYKGPWRKVVDDDGHTLIRGQRMAVCDKTYRILTSEPYAGQTIGIEPYEDIPLESAPDFDCRRTGTRDPRETKGADYQATDEAKPGTCNSTGCC